jgi:Ca-activated chloride channel family protein
MNTPQNTRDELQPDGDPRLTAYALGELEPSDRAEIEALLARDPAARAEVEAIRATAEMLGGELTAEAGEPAALTPAQRAIIESEARRAQVAPRRNVLRWMAPLAAAAALLLWVTIENRDQLAGSVTHRELEKDVAKTEAPFAADPSMTSKLEQLGYVGKGRAAVRAPAALGYAGTKSEGESIQANGSVQGSSPSPQPTYDPFSLGYVGGSKPASGAASVPRLTAKERNLGALGYSAIGYTNAAKQAEFHAAAAAVSYEESFAESRDDGRDREHPSYRYFKATPDTESYQPIVEQDFQSPFTAPLSTFGVDVDTASYSNVRRFLNNGQLPPADAVRLEELVNYFQYADAGPAADAPEGCPFGVNVQIGSAPWAPSHRLVRVALKGREIAPAARPASNLVFLLDVSGSMNQPDKLPLLKQSLALLTRQLDARDRVAIVVYAGAAGRVLDSTVCDGPGRQQVLDALDRLQAGGSTAGAAGIQLAYETASKTFVKDGTNRVILCTDGDFNVGITDRDSLQSLIAGRAQGGVFLTVLGFGEGNLKDGTAELLADKGNGLYAYIDSLDEGRRVLVQQMGGSLVIIAKDVKLQVEFNPALVGAYRLLGYENRALADRDFNDDRKDAGDIGAGHGVTALYEIVPAGEERAGVDPLKYQKAAPAAPKPELNASDELLTVNLRWKAPDADVSRKISVPVKDGGATIDAAPADLRFAAAVAGFGMKLRGSDKVRDWSWVDLYVLANGARDKDPDGWRAEFTRMVKIAAGLQGLGTAHPMSPEELEVLKSLGYAGQPR